ncbi:MerR family transcriptional regulator [Nonomuraea aridisoli]|uniref:MerR family transcriptional regulator n=1 Tax=Nonomuraea aridisoli TaxID=2070368 RepID=A0A2W2DX42_9ACTN|nr:MerR family transcriptional regulator [Nonomuraea aridisoli]PZG04398.1 MerR family transcriptional regulator [Nonomuraea aridisoli]
MLEGMDEELLPIGRFARLGRLSVKQLRHYAELGLLAPAYVDEHTGYRYYRHEQVRDALSIGLLRSLDVPLAVIAQVLSDTPGALAGVHERMEAELARRRSTLAALERVMAEGLPSAPVTLVTEPARRVAVAAATAADPSDIGRATSAAIARLLAAAPAVVPELIGLFPLDLGEPVTVTVALVGEEPVDGAELDVLPGGRFARATHVGPYDQIGLTAHALLAWCAERRHPVQGPIREVYVSDPATTPPDRLITHLMIPLEEP